MNCDPQTIANDSACLLESLSAGGNAAAMTYLAGQFDNNPPASATIRITEAGETRMTEAGDTRIIE